MDSFFSSTQGTLSACLHRGDSSGSSQVVQLDLGEPGLLCGDLGGEFSMLLSLDFANHRLLLGQRSVSANAIQNAHGQKTPSAEFDQRRHPHGSWQFNGGRHSIGKVRGRLFER